MEEKVFDKIWFQKHQSKLLWLANSFLGKYIFRFKKMGHYLDPNKKISKITPYSVAQFNGNILRKGKIRAEYTEHFFSRNEYARKLYFVLLPMWYAMHIWDWFVADHFQLAPQLSFGFSTLTQYPGSITGSNPTNGYIQNGNTNSSWATIHDATAGTSAVRSFQDAVAYNSFAQIDCNQGGNAYDLLLRSFFCFDTSSLSAGATISATVLSLYGRGKRDSTGTLLPTIDIFTSSPANTNNLVNGDYDQVGSVSQTGSPVTYANFDATDTIYTDFTFSATGRGNVSKTGISQFSAREAKYDAANSAMTLSSWAEVFFTGYYSYNGTNKPKLVVTYTLPGTVALTGTVTSATEVDIRAGGKTIILTLTGDVWVVALGGLFDAQRQNIINGCTSAQSETHGWNNEVKAKIAVTDVVRTSDTVVTITLDAEAGYDITANETITVTVPSTATLLNAGAVVASPTFTITFVVSTTVATNFLSLLGCGT